jgi:FKBP-type peptidyl-prolyl cis-trans isomerase
MTASLQAAGEILQRVEKCNESCNAGRMVNLQLEFLSIGNGASAEAGQIAVVHYTGRLADGQKFDSSVDRNEPFEVAAGVGQVIQGWDVALLRMRVGDKVKATIPPEMAYGAGGIGGVIPPNATLVFEMELLEVK